MKIQRYCVTLIYVFLWTIENQQATLSGLRAHNSFSFASFTLTSLNNTTAAPLIHINFFTAFLHHIYLFSLTYLIYLFSLTFSILFFNFFYFFFVLSFWLRYFCDKKVLFNLKCERFRRHLSYIFSCYTFLFFCSKLLFVNYISTFTTNNYHNYFKSSSWVSELYNYHFFLLLFYNNVYNIGYNIINFLFL